MFARILGTTALALALAAPVAAAGPAPIAPQSMDPRGLYPEAQAQYSPDVAERSEALLDDRDGEADETGTSAEAEQDRIDVAPQSMDPRDVYPTP